MSASTNTRLPQVVLDQLDVGIVVLDRARTVVLWNRFMALHSGRAAADVIGRDLFECFPSLPRDWVEEKLQNTKAPDFTSWQQRP